MKQLPQKGKANRIETRPAYIKDWLDALPYIDFEKTSQLLHAALRATNDTGIKPSTRLRLIKLYDRPYQYHLVARIRDREQTAVVLQQRAGMLKQIALELGLACDILVTDSLGRKPLWQSSRLPVRLMLMMMNYLSQALIFSFFEYAPAPRNIWKQLNFNYALAESHGLHKATHTLTATGDKTARTSIEHTYKRIMLAALADPHYLPVGAIWEIYAQLDGWAGRARIKPLRDVADPAGYFVLELDKNDKAMPYARFKQTEQRDNIRLLDTTPLLETIQKNIELIRISRRPDAGVMFFPARAKSLLEHMLKTWGSPSERGSERRRQAGSVELVSGVNAVYYHINGKAFQAADHEKTTDQDEICISEVTGVHHTGARAEADYPAERWLISDISSGGCALIRASRPERPPRIGDLVGINLDGPAEDQRLGVVRWLMTREDRHKMGIQNIAATVTPVALRAAAGFMIADVAFRPAFLVAGHQAADQGAIIAEKGLYAAGRWLKIRKDDRQHLCYADKLLDRGLTYEIFSYKIPADEPPQADGAQSGPISGA